MNTQPHRGLFSPEGDEGAAGAGVAETAQEIFAPTENNAATDPGLNGEAASRSGAEHHQGGSERSETAAANTAPSSVTMTNEQLSQLAAQMVKSMPQPQRQPEPQQPVTAEQQAEFDRAFNVVRVTPQIMRDAFGIEATPEQCKAFEALMHNAVRQANAMTSYQVQQEIARREQAAMGRFQPVMEYVSQQQAAALETNFFSENKDLEDFKPLVQEVTAAAKASNMRFKDRKEAFTYVATRARDLLNKARGGTPPPRQTSGARRTMPAVSTGGRTGSNNGARQPVSGPQVVFGDMDS
jgi:hypothetical protein